MVDEDNEICPDCGGTGEVTVGEYDDIQTKKCHCWEPNDTDDDS